MDVDILENLKDRVLNISRWLYSALKAMGYSTVEK